MSSASVRIVCLILVLTIIILFVFAEQTKKNRNEWKLDRIECRTTHCVTHFCELKRKSRYVQVLNGGCMLERQYHHASVQMKMYYRYRRYKPFLLDLTFDVCDAMGNNTKLNPVVSHIMPFVHKYSNFNHTCPFEGYLFVKDLVYEENLIVGGLLPVGQYRVDFRLFDPNTNESFFEESSYLTHTSYSTKDFALG